MKTCDFLVVGGGVVGLAAARELKRRRAGASVVLLEKEPACGEHASGRNSGVLHAGFYYAADSLKARLTREGNRRLAEFCDERGIPVNRCGKLVIPRDDAEDRGLDELFRRAAANGVRVEKLDAAAARRIEPRVKAGGRVLWSPTTATVDPARVVAALRADAEAAGVEVLTGTAWLAARGRGAQTSAGPIDAGYLINCAGLQADRVARGYGHSRRYAVLPFRGLYLYSDEAPGAFKTNLYPVPDPRYPFLGVHVTVAADGRAKIGPTAAPALWREHYGGPSRFSAREFVEIAALQARLFAVSDWGFRGLAVQEMRKRARARMVGLAGALAEGLKLEDYTRWGRPGLRAQLVELDTGRPVPDFLIEADGGGLHVLNMVSPGFTCSLPFADLICDEVERRAGT
ncbi:MAG: L-2-hydroxyglutarate oxidase [Elusimicrobia bacterium]|nr:L-2-hydroxyglutarate oxidase [Elusimicrobiota bacterium]